MNPGQVCFVEMEADGGVATGPATDTAYATITDSNNQTLTLDFSATFVAEDPSTTGVAVFPGDPTAIYFGTVPVGTTSSTENSVSQAQYTTFLTDYYATTAPSTLTISSITGLAGTPFSLDVAPPGACQVGTSLTAENNGPGTGVGCSIYFSYTPTATTVDTTTVTVTASNGSTVHLVLTGQGG